MSPKTKVIIGKALVATPIVICVSFGLWALIDCFGLDAVIGAIVFTCGFLGVVFLFMVMIYYGDQMIRSNRNK